jgi:phosphatidylserine synthase
MMKTLKLLSRPLLKLPASFTVFLLFFGMSLLEAFRTRNWINAAFWIAIAAMFLIADGFKLRKLGHIKDEQNLRP